MFGSDDGTLSLSATQSAFNVMDQNVYLVYHDHKEFLQEMIAKVIELGLVNTICVDEFINAHPLGLGKSVLAERSRYQSWLGYSELPAVTVNRFLNPRALLVEEGSGKWLKASKLVS